jgi:hypothetical protein
MAGLAEKEHKEPKNGTEKMGPRRLRFQASAQAGKTFGLRNYGASRIGER